MGLRGERGRVAGSGSRAQGNVRRGLDKRVVALLDHPKGRFFEAG